MTSLQVKKCAVKELLQACKPPKGEPAVLIQQTVAEDKIKIELLCLTEDMHD